MSNFDNDEDDIAVYNRVNRLKLKAGAGLNEGPGRLDPQKIKNANTVITNMASLYPKEIKNMLAALNREWDGIKALSPEDDKTKILEKFSNTANQIKDLGSTFGYDLMAVFGQSLRDYVLMTDLSMKEHLIIVQAHIDVMGVAFRENLKDDDGGPMAQELKLMVAEAIKKYTPEVIEERKQNGPVKPF